MVSRSGIGSFCFIFIGGYRVREAYLFTFGILLKSPCRSILSSKALCSTC
jgi:hypothetical protein